MELRNLRDLFIRELKDIYSAEDQIVEALPKLAEFASNSKLKDAFYNHLKTTETQIRRMEEVFKELGIEPELIDCRGIRGIIKEADEIMDQPAYREVMDAAVLAAAQKVEHYEMAAYGSARTYARLLGEDKVGELLQKTLDEEKQTDKTLTDLADGLINERAKKIG